MRRKERRKRRRRRRNEEHEINRRREKIEVRKGGWGEGKDERENAGEAEETRRQT